MYEVLLISELKDNGSLYRPTIRLRFELWQEAQSFIKSILNNCDEKIDITITKINNLDLKTIRNPMNIEDTDFND